MDRFLLKFTFLLVAISPFVALGSELACSTFFHQNEKQIGQLIFPESAKIKNPELAYRIKLTEDTRYSDPTRVLAVQDYAELFRKFGYTTLAHASDKVTFEKGKLFLGHPLDENTFVQAEYSLMSGPMTFNLVKVSFVNMRNGIEQTLAKDFVTYEGLNLMKHDFTVVFEKNSSQAKIVDSSEIKLSTEMKQQETIAETKELSGTESLQSRLEISRITSRDVAFPLHIKGPSVEKIKNWAKFLPYLAHSEIQAVDSVNKQKWAYTKGQYRRLKDFARERFFKQAFGWLMLFFIVDGMSHFSQDVAQYFVNIVQSQQSTITVKVKEKHQDGELVSKEHKLLIIPTKPESAVEKTAPSTAKGN